MTCEVGHIGPAFKKVQQNDQTVHVPLTRSEVLVMLWALGDLVKNGQPQERELANELWRKMYDWYGGRPSKAGEWKTVMLDESVWD